MILFQEPKTEQDNLVKQDQEQVDQEIIPNQEQDKERKQEL